jgi:predicted DNA-binding transcriptional regulator AlpA
MPAKPLRIHPPSFCDGDAEAAEAAAAPLALEPLLVGADQAGPLCGRSEASWWRDHAAGRIPRPVRIGGRTLWRLEELRRWVAAGCPDRQSWEATEAVRKGR